MWALIVAGQIVQTFTGQASCLNASTVLYQGRGQCMQTQPATNGPGYCVVAMPGQLVCYKQ